MQGHLRDIAQFVLTTIIHARASCVAHVQATLQASSWTCGEQLWTIVLDRPGVAGTVNQTKGHFFVDRHIGTML